MALVRRLISLTFQLGQGDFGEGGFDTVEVQGLRVLATIVKTGGVGMGTAQIQVFGMTLSMINKLSTLGVRIAVLRKNSIIVKAGDEGQILSTVFTGTIFSAWGNFQSAPQAPFVVEAKAGLFEALTKTQATSYRGSTKVELILSDLANRMNMPFVNFGVSQKISNPYYSGSPRSQAYAVAADAGINIFMDDGKLEIWPMNGSRGGAAVVVSKNHGLIGYPTIASNGIQFNMLYNPNIGFGSKINMQSDLTPANGEKTVYLLTHELESLAPKGKWQSTVTAWSGLTGEAVRR